MRAIKIEAAGRKGVAHRRLTAAIESALAEQPELEPELVEVVHKGREAANKLITLAPASTIVEVIIQAQKDPLKGWGFSLLVDVTGDTRARKN